MKEINARIIRFAALNGIVLILAAIFFFNQVAAVRFIVNTIFTAVIILVLIFSGLLIREYTRYKSAKLIMENKIMHIQAARVEDETTKISNGGSIDVYISCFGIMLDSKVIKYNTEGIALKSIEIGREFISFVYGANGKYRTLHILHGHIGQHQMEEFIKRINYETGVSPLIK